MTSSNAPAPSTRSSIISSCFRPEQNNGELIIHVKVLEQVPPQPSAPANAAQPESKPRYMLLAVSSDGKVKLHKSKRNSNGTFSIGKTWDLSELMALEVAQPTAFAITIANKSYLWETDSPAEQINFLVAIVRCFRQYTGRNVRVLGFEVNERPGAPPPYVVPAASPSLAPPQRPRMPINPSASSVNSIRSGAPQSSRMATQQSQASSVFSAQSIPAAAASSRPTHHQASSSLSNGRNRPSHPPTSASISSLAAVAPSPVAPSIPLPPQQSMPVNGRPRPTHASNSSSSLPPTQPAQSVLPLRPKQSDIRRMNGDAPIPKNIISAPKVAPSLPTVLPTKEKHLEQRPQPTELLSPPPSAVVAASSDEEGFSRPSPRRAPSRDNVVRAPPTPIVPEEDTSILENVVEMLDGFQWKGSANSSDSLGAADQIEKSLAGELAALEAASIHAIVESDDRVNFVIKHLDQAMAELEKLELMISLYKSQLNVMIDDIDHIESQNKGLQVQTSNQRALLAELDKLLDTINIPEIDLQALAQESLESQAGIERLEKAAVSLYKAILSMRDTAVGDMAAANERFGEYHRYSSQFCKRVFDFLAVMFKYQADLIIKDHERMGPKATAVLLPHKQFEAYLERYVGLMLFVKEIDDQRYHQICAAYFATTSDLYRFEIGNLFTFCRSLVRKPTDEDLESTFSHANASPNLRSGLLKRGPTMKSPALGSTKNSGDQVQPGDALRRALLQIDPHVMREQQFVADLLHLTGIDSYITFADFTELENFFRRGASAHMVVNFGRFKDLKSSMDLIFGFIHQDLSDFVDGAIGKDTLQIVGVLAAIDASILECQRSQNDFLLRALQKQGLRCVAVLDQIVKEQVKAIEQTRLTLKKRKGIAPFVNVFPHFSDRIESQLTDAQHLPIRALVDSKYDLIVSTMFECLQQMAKMDGEAAAQAEDKDQLNYHVVLIENMGHLLAVGRDLRVPALASHLKRARDIYDENLGLYIKLALRRPFAKLADFFSGLEQLLKTTPANEVSLHSAYNKSSAKKAAGSVSIKDMRRAVEALSKRVEKHFTDQASPSSQTNDILRTVWQACGDEAVKMVSIWLSHIKRCYAETSVALEFTSDDVATAFQRNRPSGTAA